jgi:hypothetical protein
MLPTEAARVRAQVNSCGISDGQSGTGALFLVVLRFPLPILIHWRIHIHNVSSGADTIGELLAYVLSGLSLNPPKKTKYK